MAENLQIRLSDPGEADRLAEIEAVSDCKGIKMRNCFAVSKHQND